MSPETRERPSPSLISRFISSQRSPWITLGVGLALILVPVGVAYIDGVLRDFFSQGYWRPALLPPAVIIYIMVVSPILGRGETGVIEAFRPLVQTDDDSFNQLVYRASRLNPIAEVTAFGIGGAFGIALSLSSVSDSSVLWLGLYLALSEGLMFGLLGWVIYAAMAGNRLMAELHRQPLRIDIFDTKPFRPVGRQSLVIALVFVGGIALSMLFTLGEGSIFAWQNWVISVCIVLVPISLFFLNMRDTHRVLAAEKNRQLELVEHNIRQGCRTLMDRISTNEGTGTLAAEINALVAYEERLRAVRTWPYDIAMLRTLFVSVIIPGGAALARFVFEMLYE